MNKNPSCLLSLILFSSFFLSACTHSKEEIELPEGWTTISLEAYNLALFAPQEWEMVEKPAMRIPLALLSPRENESDPFRENVNISIMPSRLFGLKDFYARNMEPIKVLLNQYESISEEEVNILGMDAIRSEYYHQMGDYRLHVLSYTFVWEEKGYIFTGTATDSSFQTYNSVFEGIIASIQLGLGE